MSEKFFVSLEGWDEADSFNRLPPGGQICTIVNAFIAPSKSSNNDTLYVEVDVAKGDYKGFFHEQKNYWKNHGVVV